MAENLINIKQRSFVKLDDALEMCGLLLIETGKEYTVISDNNLGFTFKRIDELQPNVINNENQAKKFYRPALRGFIPNYLQILIGLFVIKESGLMVDLFFDALNISPVPDWLNSVNWQKGFKIIGLIIAVYGLRFMYCYFASMLFFDEDGVVLKTGIIAQKQIQIRFGDIKTIGVDQTVQERILGIGTLELDSAGTDGVDIRFRRTVNPTAERRRIQHMIDNHV